MPTRHSINRRLTGSLLIGVGVLLLMTGLTLAFAVGQLLKTEYDNALIAQAWAFSTLTEQDIYGIELELRQGPLPIFETKLTSSYFQLWSSEGNTLARSPSLGEADLGRQPRLADAPLFTDITLPNGRAGRRVQIDFLPRLDEADDEADAALLKTLPRQPVVLAVARERESLDQMLSALYLTLLTAGVVVMALVVFLVRLAVHHGLRPLDDVRRQIEQLDAQSLGARLVQAQRTEELEAMIEQFNALLARLETAFERERCFSADVAHELRTPLAELRSLAEVGQRWPDDRELSVIFFHDVIDATVQMERIVTNLLALARSERGLDVLDHSTFDLIELITNAWQQTRLAVTDKQLEYHYTGPATLWINSGQEQWQLILNNLLNNAASYCPDADTVRVAITVDANSLELQISNRAEQLEHEDLVHLFERLWRKDSARTDGYHAGLGLTLVQAYAQQLKLQIEPRLTAQHEFTIRLSGVIVQPL